MRHFLPHCMCATAHSPLQARTSIYARCAVQVHLHYGSYDSAHLLVFYGFVLPDNPNDSVSISIKVRLRCSSLIQNRLGVQAFHLPQHPGGQAAVHMSCCCFVHR